MSMQDLVDILDEQGRGVRAYAACMLAARERITTHHEQSAAYFLLADAAARFVDAYDDQPLSSQRAEEEYAQFKHYVDKLAHAPDTNHADILTTLNSVAEDIASHKFRRLEV